MKRSFHMITVVLAAAMVASLFIACGGGGGGGSSAVNPSAYPAAADSSEGSGGDDTAMTASTISVGETQVRTIFPAGDIDWVAVDLTAGTEYEFSANNLAVATDAYMYLFSTDGTTELAEADDYIDYDPQIVFTPGTTGTYYLQVMSYDQYDSGDPIGLVAYTLGAREYVDSDGDGFSTYYDCDDTDDEIYPWADEIADDGIDQSCSGTDQLVGDTPDSAEDDDDMGSAVAMLETSGSLLEIIYRSAIYTENGRTIDTAGESDWFSVTVPAHSLYGFFMVYEDNCIDGTAYESDGVTVVDTGNEPLVANTSSSAKSYFVEYEGCGGTDTGYYVPTFANFGVDMDGDDYYTQDWEGERDCDDSDAGINPGATDSTVDGTDQDCDGVDG